MKIRPSPVTAAIAGVFSAVTMPLLWPRLQADSVWLMLAFVLLVALPAHAFVVGFERTSNAANTLDIALLKRIGAWLGATAVVLVVAWMLGRA